MAASVGVGGMDRGVQTAGGHQAPRRVSWSCTVSYSVSCTAGMLRKSQIPGILAPRPTIPIGSRVQGVKPRLITSLSDPLPRYARFRDRRYRLKSLVESRRFLARARYLAASLGLRLTPSPRAYADARARQDFSCFRSQAD